MGLRLSVQADDRRRQTAEPRADGDDEPAKPRIRGKARYLPSHAAAVSGEGYGFRSSTGVSG
jgi:hypothetical protein